tara:strand:+ start:1163 stop:1744 length:582 start_codon:yes stop_codon:yes gene_type:complete
MLDILIEYLNDMPYDCYLDICSSVDLKILENELNDIKYKENYINALITLNIILVFSIILMMDIKIIDIPLILLKQLCDNLLSYAGYKPEDIEYYNENYVITEDILKVKQDFRKFKKEINKKLQTDIFNISMDLNNIKKTRNNVIYGDGTKEYVEYYKYKRELFKIKDNFKILSNDISTLKRNMILCIPDNDKM